MSIPRGRDTAILSIFSREGTRAENPKPPKVRDNTTEKITAKKEKSVIAARFLFCLLKNKNKQITELMSITALTTTK